MVSEPFRAYPSECLLSLSSHPLSDRYRTTHNILSHTQAVTLDMRGVLEISHRLEIVDISLYISGCKPHLMSRFYGVALGLKSTL